MTHHSHHSSNHSMDNEQDETNDEVGKEDVVNWFAHQEVVGVDVERTFASDDDREDGADDRKPAANDRVQSTVSVRDEPLRGLTQDNGFYSQPSSHTSITSMNETLAEIQRLIDASQASSPSSASAPPTEAHTHPTSHSTSGATALSVYRQLRPDQTSNTQGSTVSEMPRTEHPPSLSFGTGSGDKTSDGVAPTNMQWWQQAPVSSAAVGMSVQTNLAWTQITQQQTQQLLSMAGPNVLSQFLPGGAQHALLQNFLAATLQQQQQQQQQEAQCPGPPEAPLQALLNAIVRNSSLPHAVSSNSSSTSTTGCSEDVIQTLTEMLAPASASQPLPQATINSFGFQVGGDASATSTVPSIAALLSQQRNDSTSAAGYGSAPRVAASSAVSLDVNQTSQEAPPTKRQKRPYKHESFPSKLHRLLAEVEAQDKDDIISFNLEGTAILIHQPEVFEEEIIPQYFRHSKLSSFKRQLSMYGFTRIPEGPDEGGFAHPLFRKGQPQLSKGMDRIN